MRAIASFLFLTSITLLLCTHHALARMSSECVVIRQGGWQEQRPYRKPPTAQQERQVVVLRPSQQEPIRITTPSSKSLHLSVTGNPQKDEKLAYQNALGVAREQLVIRLRELKPDLRWEGPRLSQLERLITNKKTESEFFKQPINDVMYTTRLELDLPPNEQASLLRQVRLEEAGSRQLFLLKPLLAVLAVLLTVACYYRLEDMTKGYYTLLLRLFAALLLVLLGAGIFVWA